MATEQQQAAFFHARERRRSLAGIPELHRNAQIVGPAMAAVIPAVLFPTTATLVTFKTAIRTTGPSPQGLVFALGDAAAGIALWLDVSQLGFHAGSAGTVDGATAILDNTVALPDDMELDIVVSARPGDGRVRMWTNGREAARSTASGGSFPLGFANAVDGSFAQAGATTADVTAAGSPADFQVIEPLSIYMKQVPRHFV